MGGLLHFFVEPWLKGLEQFLQGRCDGANQNPGVREAASQPTGLRGRLAHENVAGGFNGLLQGTLQGFHRIVELFLVQVC